MSNGLASKCLDTIKLGHGVASLWDHDLFLSFGEYVVITGLIEASVPEAVDDTALRAQRRCPKPSWSYESIAKTARWSD